MEEKKKKCKHCKEEIDAKAKVCPHCRKKQSNPILTVIVVLFIIGALGSCMGKGSDTKSTPATTPPAAAAVEKQVDKDAVESENKAEELQSNEPTPQNPQNTETMGQKNALSAAKNYLSFAPFSHSGLIKQLEFENYSTEDATYAADNCGADWNEQAAKSAENYLSFTSFSRSGLIDQLKFEGFTAEQAEYGVKAVGY